MEETDLTPLMKQYLRIKESHKDALLFYRMGDFYEMFFEDAEIGSREMDIVLTARDKGPYGGKIPLAGIPYHALDSYLPKLVKKGYKVAIAEQVEDPKKAKGIVKREVVRVVTPGTMILPEGQQEKGNTFLSAVTRRLREGNEEALAEDKGSSQERVAIPPADYGVAHLDVSTGDFHVTEITGEGAFHRLVSELLNYGSVEVLLPDSLSKKGVLASELGLQLGDRVALTPFPDHHFLDSFAEEALRSQLNVLSLEGYGLDGRELALGSAGAVLAYARENQMCDLAHIRILRFMQGTDHMVLDSTTLRNLEVLRNNRDGTAKGTLLEVLDQCRTAMGSRALRSCVQHPLLDLGQISHRLDAVELLAGDLFLRSDIRETLGSVSDMERTSMRLSLGRATGRDLRSLSSSLKAVSELKDVLSRAEGLPDLLVSARDGLDPLPDTADLIDRAIVEDPPLSIKEGGLIREGYSPELDEIRHTSGESRQWLREFEEVERRRTGIRSLKVRFNNVFGYFIEVTNANLDMVPDHYIRKQTLSNAERFITPELKEREALILTAQDRMASLEHDLFQQVCASVLERSISVQNTARSAAIIDVLNTLSDISSRKGYRRPEVHEGRGIVIRDGRHPVIEDKVAWGFVPNDTDLGPPESGIMVLTGPNMAGKSTFMRQAALIVIMAQMGSFVPASSARIGLVDRIFTRVGASDDLARGQSTFMVEMIELAGILNGVTDRSLVLLDEIGRGTSTYDGMAIAWSVVEFLAGPERTGTITIFATHYHSLTSLEGTLKGVVNYQMSVLEDANGITFLRKVARGPASRSYGIEVADLAGVPKEVVERAKEVLAGLEDGTEEPAKRSKMTPSNIRGTVKKGVQMVLFPTEDMVRTIGEDPLREELRRIDPNNVTPMQALELLYRLRKKASE